ncbi:MAG: preprotein translocase subunit SecG [Sphaerochaetaceae bacterium]|nr:preprotein translocase subunit SecG [Sphaerochaetaceae bacterium]
MAALSIILLVLFVLVSLLLIFVIAIQSEDDSGLGGVFGGNSTSVFGGNTNKVLNKVTAYLVVAFFVLAVLVAIVNKSSENSILSTAKTTTATVQAEN